MFMLSLMDTELYKSKGIQARIDSELRGAVRLQLMRNIGINDEVVLKTMNQLVDELQNMLPNELLDNRQ